MRWRVRRLWEATSVSRSTIEASRTMSGVPSCEPPSTFTSAVLSRASSRLKARWAARTTGPTLSEWLRVGRPTSTSTWPTAISSESSSSERIEVTATAA
jgi:hypothetical protein